MATQISRDPFARTTLVREIVATTQTCGWCGGVRLHPKARGRSLFRYGTAYDDRGGINWHRNVFCCLSCHDSYHDTH